MIRDFLLSLSALLLVGLARATGHDCAYDQTAQLEKLQRVAAAQPRARLDPAKRMVAWTGLDQVEWIVTYGGCTHLGYAVTSRKSKSAPSKQSAVLRAAARAASEFWDRRDAADLKRAIHRGQFERRTDGVVSTFSMAHETYDVFEVEHRFQDGVESITVRWVSSL